MLIFMFLDLTSWHPLLVFWTGFSVSSLYSYFAGVFFHAVCLDILGIAIFLIGLYNPWDQIAIFIERYFYSFISGLSHKCSLEGKYI